MNLIRNISALLLSVFAFTASAQYNPTVEVEGEYAPDYIPQDRINTFPQRQKFRPIEGSLGFDTEGVITPFTPTGVPMEATAWQASRFKNPYRGFLNLSIGSWLNANLNAGYKFLQTQNSDAGIYLHHNSTSLWKPDLSEATHNTQRELYDETIGAYFTHKADNKGVLNADLHYNFAYFNYYGTYYEDFQSRSETLKNGIPSQTWNDLKFSILWNSDPSARFGYHVGADVRYSAFRRFYSPELHFIPSLPDSEIITFNNFKGSRQTDIILPLGVSYKIKSSSTIGLDLKGQLVFNSTEKSDYADFWGSDDNMPGNYGMITILPYYRFDKGNLHIQVAPRFDLALNTEVPKMVGYEYFDRTKGRIFHISPDIRINYHTRKFAIDMTIAGGAQLPTLGGNHDLDFYCQPAIFNTKPTYSPIDAKLALGFGPFAGFQAGTHIAWRTTLSHRFGGLYQSYLNAYNDDTHGNLMIDNSRRIGGYSAGVTLKWSYGELISILAEGTLQPQHDGFAYFTGYDMPRYTLHSSISSSPVKALHLSLDYDLRAMRMPLTDDSNDRVGDPAPSSRIPNWSNLSFDVGYDIADNLSVGVTLDNLLCRRQYILPGLPTPRLTALANLSWKF